MSVMLIIVSHDTVVSNKHEERTRHYYVNFQHITLSSTEAEYVGMTEASKQISWIRNLLS